MVVLPGYAWRAAFDTFQAVDQHALWTSIQQINWGRRDLAKTLGIAPDNVRLVSPYIGGGGGKGIILCDAVLAALGARAAGRSSWRCSVC